MSVPVSLRIAAACPAALLNPFLTLSLRRLTRYPSRWAGRVRVPKNQPLGVTSVSEGLSAGSWRGTVVTA